jgi:CheY-like chemotaxis protein
MMGAESKHMRVLIVDPDGPSASVLEDRLDQAGLDVGCASSPAQLDALLRIRPADVVICDLSRRRMNGFDIARNIHAQTKGRTEIVLMSPTHSAADAEIRALMTEVGARFFYAKPIDPDVLLQGIHSPRPAHALEKTAAAKGKPPSKAKKRSKKVRAKAGSAKKTAPKQIKVAWPNARTLVEHWAQRTTGTLRVRGNDVSGHISIKEGGLVDPTHIRLVQAVIEGAQTAFEPGHVDGVGDWALLGNQVFMLARTSTDAGTIRGYMNAVPVAKAHTELARSLEIKPSTRKLLGAIDSERTIETLIESTGTTSGDVSEDLEALVQLGLVALTRGEGADGAGPDDDSVAGALSMDLSEEETMALDKATESADLEGLPTLDSSTIANAHLVEEPDQIRQRLIRELDTISSASPPVVLGVPADAVVRLVDEAAARMRRRYDRLAATQSLPEDVRKMAGKMVREIGRAHKYFDFSVGHRTGSDEVDGRPSAEDEVIQLLTTGRGLIARGQWSEADAALTRAHKLQLDHVGVLANLGWARLHNTKKDPARRADEGRDFLLLAEQFDDSHRDGQFYLAQLLLVGDNLEVAAIRAQRAMDADPGEPKRAALHRKIQVKLAAVASEAR